MEEDIEDLVANEKADRALMYAEMDTMKAEESLKKETEKMAKSSWFQTKDQTKEKKKLVKGGDPGAANGGKDAKGKKDNQKGKKDSLQKGKRGAEDSAGGKKKKAKHSHEEGGEEQAPKDNGQFAKAAKRSYKAAIRRGEVTEQDESKNAKKKKGPRKMTNFEKKMKQLENEKLGTGKKRSKNQFKSSKKYKRR